jgi:hypothetical protein
VDRRDTDSVVADRAPGLPSAVDVMPTGCNCASVGVTVSEACGGGSPAVVVDAGATCYPDAHHVFGHHAQPTRQVNDVRGGSTWAQVLSRWP